MVWAVNGIKVKRDVVRHLDLFSGIGGFAYAADQVFGEVEHVFCDNDKFCQQVLKKHWPESEIFDDIKDITNDTIKRVRQVAVERQSYQEDINVDRRIDLLTGGFPCQPFSAAGARRGTADERYLWPEMLRVIRLTKPRWIIAENVRGILTWDNGLVFEQVCTDLEAEGYIVQPFIIPAVAVDAPHRRDRIWFVAYTDEKRSGRGYYGDTRGSRRSLHATRSNSHVANTSQSGLEGFREADNPSERRQESQRSIATPAWGADWPDVAASLCGVDDGLPVELDGSKLTKSQHRKERLKACGNAIVPQVAMQIMEAIRMTPPTNTQEK